MILPSLRHAPSKNISRRTIALSGSATLAFQQPSRPGGPTRQTSAQSGRTGTGIGNAAERRRRGTGWRTRFSRPLNWSGFSFARVCRRPVSLLSRETVRGDRRSGAYASRCRASGARSAWYSCPSPSGLGSRLAGRPSGPRGPLQWEGGASIKSDCSPQAVFIPAYGPKAHKLTHPEWSLLREELGKRNRRSLHSAALRSR
jgi:hypothetical protein